MTCFTKWTFFSGIFHTFSATNHYFQLNQSHLFRPTAFFVGRCILLFQLHHQPSSLLFDVEKVKYKQYFSISLSLSLYFLMLITFGILIYVVFFYYIFCSPFCFSLPDQSCTSYFDLCCIFLLDILHLQVPPRFHWYSKEHRSASGLFSLWKGSARCKTFSKYFSKIVVNIS